MSSGGRIEKLASVILAANGQAVDRYKSKSTLSKDLHRSVDWISGAVSMLSCEDMAIVDGMELITEAGCAKIEVASGKSRDVIRKFGRKPKYSRRIDVGIDGD